MKIFGGFRIVASTVWIGWIRGYENPNVNGFQILWQKRFSAKTKCPHRSCSIDSLEKRLLLARGNAANSMWLPRMPKKQRRGYSSWEKESPAGQWNVHIYASWNAIYRCFSKCYISMFHCFSKCFSKRRLSLIEKKDCSLKSTKMSAHGIQTFPWEERPCRKSASTESMAAQLKAKLATQ